MNKLNFHYTNELDFNYTNELYFDEMNKLYFNHMNDLTSIAQTSSTLIRYFKYTNELELYLYYEPVYSYTVHYACALYCLVQVTYMTERGWVIYCCFWDCTGSASLFGSFNVFFIEWAYIGEHDCHSCFSGGYYVQVEYTGIYI